MSEDICKIPTLTWSVLSVQCLGTFIVYDVSQSHHHFMEMVGMVVSLHSPGSSEITLRYVDNEANGMRIDPINMGHHPCSILVLPNAVHIHLLDITPHPLLNNVLLPLLPNVLQMPWYLYVVDVGFPVVDKDSLLVPFLLEPMGQIAVVVIV